MFKKILFFIVVLFFGFAMWQGYIYFQKVKIPVLPAFNAVPPNAVLVFQFKNIENTWGKVIASNKLWSDLLNIKSFATMNESGVYLNKIIQKNGEFRKILKEKPLVVSLHLSGAQSYDFLYCISLPTTKNPAEVKNEIFSLLHENQIFGTKKYEQDEIYSLPLLKLKTDLYFTIKNNILIFSFSNLLIQDAIRNLNLPSSERSTELFAELEKSAAINTDGNIYTNYKFLAKFFSMVTNREAHTANFFKSTFADWGGFDLTIEPSTIGLNGFTYTKDSTSNYIDLFKTQQPQEIHIPSLIPYNTTYLLNFGYSDFQLFLNNYKEFLDKDKGLFSYQKKINKREQECGCDISNSALGWIGNESAVVITEAFGDDWIENKYILFSALEIDKALEQLAELSLQIIDTSSISPKEEYKNFTIFRLPLHNLYEDLLGEGFAGADIEAYTVIENYIIFGHSSSALKNIINNFISQKTLNQEESYIKQSNHIEDKSNILLYTNISKSAERFKKYLRKDYAADYESNLATFEKFNSFSFQCSNFKTNQFYTNITLQHNPLGKSTVESKNWQIDLQKNIDSELFILENHSTKEKDIFLQDVDNNIYLINANGKIVWKKLLIEKIIGKVSQIDVLKNNKLQIVFNTNNFIYVIDRNGNNVEGFPIKLPSKATTELAIFDYDQTRNYRFMIACENKNLYGYGTDGKVLPTWHAEKTIDKVFFPAQHIRVKDKDYIFIVENSGKSHLLDRQGKKRIDIKSNLFELVSQPIFIINSNEIGTSQCIFLNRKGELIKQSLDGNKKILRSGIEEESFCQLLEINGNKEIIIQEKEQILVLDLEGKLIFEHEISGNFKTKMKIFHDNKSKINDLIFYEKENENFIVIDKIGNVSKTIPALCDGKFASGNLKNTDEINLITTNGSLLMNTFINEE